MFQALFAKPKTDKQEAQQMREAEDALDLRMKRMMRQGMPVKYTAPPLHPPKTKP